MQAGRIRSHFTLLRGRSEGSNFARFNLSNLAQLHVTSTIRAAFRGKGMDTRYQTGYFLVCVVLAGTIFARAQTPMTLGPLTVTVPVGWSAQTNAVPVKIFSPGSTPQQFLEIDFFPPEQTSDSLNDHHARIWGKMSALMHPLSPPQSGTLGQFIWTKVELPRAGQREILTLFSIKNGNLYMAIAADASNAALMSRNAPAIEAMLKGALFIDPSASSSVPPPGNASATAPLSPGDPATLSNYVYTPPPGWAGKTYSDGIVLTPSTPISGEPCLISLWPMRLAGANLQSDADGIFREIFSTYHFIDRDGRGGDMPPIMARGASGQGWDYLILRRGISKSAGPSGPYAMLLGFVFVARLNNNVAVISGISKDSLVSACFGELVNNVWPRFFYSLSFKNFPPKDQALAMHKRMAGVWTAATATAGTQFTFAANGRYADAAARQQYTLTTTELLTTTQAYFGDGAYTLKGNSITLTQDGRRNQPEHGFVRVEEQSKDGGATWTPFLYLLRTSAVDGKDYEVQYHKTR